MRASASRVYYGWYVLAAGAVSELLAQGATSYSAGLFVLPLQAEFHISRADAGSAVLLLFLGSACVAPLVGKILDRYPIRWVMALGAGIFAAALAGIAFSPSLWLMALLLLLPAATGFMIIGPLTTSTLASRWFHRRRGLALGIAAVATSGGGLVVVPLLSRTIELYGWRLGLFYESLAIGAIVLALASLVLRDRPATIGLDSHPENRGQRQAEDTIRGGRILRWRDILTSRDFWVPSLALASISGTSQAIVVTLVPYGVQLGFAVTAAAFAISAFSTGAAVTKIAAGFLADRFSPRLLLLAASAFMVLAMILLCGFKGYGMVLAASALAGVSLGCALPTAAAWIAAGFGSDSFGAAMGWTYTLVLVFAILAVRFIGSVYDGTGGYGPGFAGFAALSALVLAVTFLSAPKRAP